jgi:hypothetical protein
MMVGGRQKLLARMGDQGWYQVIIFKILLEPRRVCEYGAIVGGGFGSCLHVYLLSDLPHPVSII